MFEFEEGVEHWIQQHLKKRTFTKTGLPRQTHVFTHFKLHYTPVRIILKTKLEIEPGEWFESSALKTIGLPAPVSKLLQGIL